MAVYNPTHRFTGGNARSIEYELRKISQTIGDIPIGDITAVTAGNGLSGGGASGDVTLALDINELSVATVATGDYVAIEDITDNGSKKVTAQSIADLAPQGDITGVTAGTLVDVTDPTGPVPTVNVDLSEAATSTSDADGDYFLVTDAAAAQYKLTKANIALSGMNNDSGWTSNTGDVESVSGGTNLTAVNSGGPDVTLNLDANITGDITFDTDVLAVDATNNRVGIGTASPVAPLHIEQAATDGSPVTILRNATNGAGVGIDFSDHATGGSYAQMGSLEYRHTDSQSYGYGNSFLVFGTESTLVFRVTGHGMFVDGTTTVSGTQIIAEGRYGGYGAGVSFRSATSNGGTVKEMAKITGDGESAWDTDAADQDAGLRFFTCLNGTLAEKVRINASGYLGIGQTTPAAMLEVGGDSADGEILVTSTAGRILTLEADDSGNYVHMGSKSNHALRIVTNDTEAMYITSAQTIGIGITAPINSSKVDIRGIVNLTAGAFASNITIGGDDIQASQTIGVTSMRGGVLVYNLNDYRSLSTKASFMHYDPYDDALTTEAYAFRAMAGASLVDTFWVKGTGTGYFKGNVGIGTPAPSGTLDVEDPTNAYIYLNDSGGTVGAHTNSRLIFQANGSQAGVAGFAATTGGLMRFQNNDGAIYIQTDSSDGIYMRTNDTTRVLFQSTGTTWFYYDVNIAGNTYLTGGKSIYMDTDVANSIVIRIDANNRDVSIVRFSTGEWSTSGDYGGDLRYCGTGTGNNNRISFFMDNQNAASQVEALTILQDGKVGIGDNTPSYELDVNGTIRGTTHMYVTGTDKSYAAADPDTGTDDDAQWVSVLGTYYIVRNSSRRADKENETTDLGDFTLDLIDDLTITKFNRKNKPSVNEVGLISDDVEVVSQMLTNHGTDENGDVILGGINKTGWLSLVTLAVQDIRTRLTALEAA